LLRRISKVNGELWLILSLLSISAVLNFLVSEHGIMLGFYTLPTAFSAYPVRGSLRRILAIILSHHDRYDGTGYRPKRGEDIPVEARIIAVADAYDAITSDRPYRKASTPYEGSEIIVNGSGKEFDPTVVDAFCAAFSRQEMEVPELVV